MREPAVPPTPTATPGSGSAATAATGLESPTDVVRGVPIGIPEEAEEVIKKVNPKGEAPYSGPTGTLRGTVRLDGSPPPDVGLSVPASCSAAAATYGKLFRVGPAKALADTLVAVTHYQGFVPAASAVVRIPIRGCALEKRTLAVTFGQRIEVNNLDTREPYQLYLDGSSMKTPPEASPGGPPIAFFPKQPGHYTLRERRMSALALADVFVVAYPTHDVTGPDGRFEIKGIPVGKAQANAYLPAIDKVMNKEIEIKAGDNTTDFILVYGGEKAPG